MSTTGVKIKVLGYNILFIWNITLSQYLYKLKRNCVV